METYDRMKPISELGLELIELDDQVLLVDKLEHTNNRLILHQSINGKVNHFYKGDDIDLDDYNARRFLGLTFNVIASTKPLKGIPLLVIEDESELLATQEYGFNSSSEAFKNWKRGYNKAKEKYRYTEKDLRKALWELGDALFNNNQSGIKEGEPELYFDTIIKSLTKKELWVDVIDIGRTHYIKDDNNRFNDVTGINFHKYEWEIKITDGKIKAIWKEK